MHPPKISVVVAAPIIAGPHVRALRAGDPRSRHDLRCARLSVLHVELPELCHLRGGGVHSVPKHLDPFGVLLPGQVAGRDAEGGKAPVDVANSSGVSPVSS